MDPPDLYDIPPIRPGVAPTLDLTPAGANVRSNRQLQPGWARLTEILVRIVRAHFSDANKIEFADLAARVWTADPTSPIVISSLAEWKPDASNQRPAVLVDRLDQQKDMQNRGIGDQFQGVRPGHFADFWQGSHVCHCLGGREGEADVLAAEVSRELKKFSPVIREAACLTRLLVMQVGKRVQLSGEHKDHYTVPIVMAYCYQDAWRITPTDEATVTMIRSFFQNGS